MALETPAKHMKYHQKATPTNVVERVEEKEFEMSSRCSSNFDDEKELEISSKCSSNVQDEEEHEIISLFGISPMPSNLSPYDIYLALRQYGEVDRVSNDSTDELIFRMIQTAEIGKLPPTHSIEINGITITVTHIRDESTKQTIQPKTITTLNNDCLHEIFKYLPSKDLQSLSMSCKRLNDVTYDVMRGRRLKNIGKSKKVHISGYRQLWRFEEYLLNHGHLISEAHVHDRNHGARIESGMVADYCVNITELHCSVSETTHCWEGHEFYRFFDSNSKIEKLTIQSEKNVSITLPPVALPQLKHLSLLRVRILDAPSTQLFFQLNAQIEYLSIHDCGEITIENIEPIRYLKNLKRICLQSKQKTSPFSVACRTVFRGSFSAWGERHYTWTFSSFH